MDVRALLHNRWILGGVGLAAVAGVYVLIKKQRSGGGASTSQAGGGSTNPTYASGSVGSFDSTGTDVASWLGNYSANLDNQFKEFQKNVSDQLAGIPTGPTGTGAPTASNDPSPASLPDSLTAPAGVNLYNWSQDIESRYGVSSAVFDQIRGQGALSWINDPSYAYGKVPVFNTATTVSVR